MRRLALWIAKATALLLALCFAAAVLNMHPGNPALFPPKPGEVAVTVYVVSYGYHSGLVLTRADLVSAAEAGAFAAINDILDRFRDFDSLEFGWGDEVFYQHVRSVKDLQIGEALHALFMPGNKSVMHVVGLRDEPRIIFRSADIAEIHLSQRGFARMAQALDQSFALGEDGHAEEIGPGLYGPSLFYRANGSFNLFNVCNHWVANLLQRAGLPANPFLATLPQGLFFDLSIQANVEMLPR
jgi:uncharacterized protein (TIGR02117 family)